MIHKLIAYCATHRFLVFTATIGLTLLGLQAMQRIPLDAIPDLSDTQVIILSRWDRSPDIMEDQVTYPIVTALLGAPRVKAVRGISDFGYSFVYVIFEDGTDIYWGRSRVLEYLSKILPQLPEGVRTELGPDATGVGWVFQYAFVNASYQPHSGGEGGVSGQTGSSGARQTGNASVTLPVEGASSGFAAARSKTGGFAESMTRAPEIDESGQQDLAQLRSFQDWNLRYLLQAVPGVAEVATVGGFVRQYQVQVDPNKLLAYNIPIDRVVEAVRQGNNDVGARLMEFAGAEYMVRGRGYIKSLSDVEQIAVGRDENGAPILVRQIATVSFGPDIRRGVADLDGRGDTVGGVVVIRYGENALHVINRVKAKLATIALPPGVKLVTTYDRSDLIYRAIDTVKVGLLEEMVVVALVILLFLWHPPSAVVPIIAIPVSVILSFIPMQRMGLTSNIMSLGGIAVAIGALVDASIVVVENVHKRLEAWEAGGRKGPVTPLVIAAAQEVGRSAFYSLLVIAVAFLPIFALEGQEGRLFKPLAFTKNFSMAIAAVASVTLAPALLTLLIRTRPIVTRWPWVTRWCNLLFVGSLHAEEHHPISRRLFRWYEPAVRFVLDHPHRVIRWAVVIVLVSLFPFLRLGGEFMPPLNEGTILYMPTTLPGISITEAQRLLQAQDTVLKSFPEVVSVFGKAGRAETATDPAPLSMMETTVVLKPVEEWREVRRWYSWLPDLLEWPFRRIWPNRLTWEELVYDTMDPQMQFPGATNAWTMPIKNRIDMLATGIRTPIGIKVMGPDLAQIERIGAQLETAIRQVKGTKSVYAERVTGGYFLDITLKREELARYGLSVEAAHATIMSAIGGENVTRTVEGRARYPVSVRYARELRGNVDDLRRVFVATSTGEQLPLAAIADIEPTTGPGMIRDENGLLAGYVYIDMQGRDIAGYVAEAKDAVARHVAPATGYTLEWSGQYEYMERVRAKLTTVVPLTLLIVFFLIYLNTGSGVKTAIVLCAVPFSAVGAFWLLWLLGYNMSIAVWVGIIALLGLDAETGVFMLLYLDLAYDAAKADGRLRSVADLKEAIVHGAVRRIRPKFMTVATTFIGLVPIMWSMGTGADVMKRVAAPMIGGLATSFAMELLVYPAIYFLWKQRELQKTGVIARNEVTKQSPA